MAVRRKSLDRSIFVASPMSGHTGNSAGSSVASLKFDLPD